MNFALFFSDQEVLCWLVRIHEDVMIWEGVLGGGTAGSAT